MLKANLTPQTMVLLLVFEPEAVRILDLEHYFNTTFLLYWILELFYPLHSLKNTKDSGNVQISVLHNRINCENRNINQC